MQNHAPSSILGDSSIDISQTKILSQLAIYLKQEKRDPLLIAQLQEGQCCGFSSLSLYGVWLELNVPKNPLKPRDDWSYLKKAYEKICSWDPTQQLGTDDKAEFERILSLIIDAQSQNNATLTKTKLTQGELDLSLIDTQGRKAQKEYSLGGMFALHDLYRKQMIHRDGGIKTSYLMSILAAENRMVMIGSHNHATGLIRKNNTIYYSNSNFETGIAVIENCDTEASMLKLSQLIFEAHFGPGKKLPGPLGFLVYSFEKAKVEYPPQEELLKNTLLIQAKNVNYSRKAYNQVTALGMATLIGCQASAKFYLDHKVDVNAKNRFGKTALHLAAANGDVSFVKELLLKKPTINLAAMDNDGYAPLDYAVSHGHFEMTDLLLYEMTKKDIKFNIEYINRLISLSKDANIRMLILEAILASELISPSPQHENINALRELIHCEENKTTLLHKAVYREDPVQIKKALASFISINGVDGFSRTALHLVAEKGKVELFHLIRQEGINLNARDDKGKTALHYAIENNHIALALLLVESLADPAIDDNNGRNALVYLGKASVEMKKALEPYIESWEIFDDKIDEKVDEKEKDKVTHTANDDVYKKEDPLIDVEPVYEKDTTIKTEGSGNSSPPAEKITYLKDSLNASSHFFSSGNLSQNKNEQHLATVKKLNIRR